jgi:cytochrome c-type biogenesis protein CcmH/NrfF
MFRAVILPVWSSLLVLLAIPAIAISPESGEKRGGVSVSTLSAQIPEGVEGTYVPHPEARAAISRLLSPYCPGLMLDQCPSDAARILRDSIHALALQGWNSDAIEAWMLSNHGEQYRAVPKRSGAGLLAWLLPPLALLLGLGGVGAVLRRFVGKGRAEGEATLAAAGTGGGAGLTGAQAGSAVALPSGDQEARLREAIQDLEFSEDPVY